MTGAEMDIAMAMESSIGQHWVRGQREMLAKECPAGKAAGGRIALTYELVRSKKEKKWGNQERREWL